MGWKSEDYEPPIGGGDVLGVLALVAVVVLVILGGTALRTCSAAPAAHQPHAQPGQAHR